jgi:hypothetical protein
MGRASFESGRDFTMRRAQGASIAIGLLLLAAATTAHAVESARSVPLQVSGQSESRVLQTGAATPTSNTKSEAPKGRWGLMDEVSRFGNAVKNVLAGAYYKLTPALKLGYGPNENPDAVKNGDAPKTPRVKLEANFNF